MGFWAVACGRTLPHPPYIQQPSSALVAVAAEPPPARVEHVPPRPAAKGAVWLDGEWTERRGRWAWKPGRWVVAPPGASYSPWAFVRGLDGAPYFAPGTFRDAQGAAVDEPPPLAVARPSVVPVIGPDGLAETVGRTIRLPTDAGAPPR